VHIHQDVGSKRSLAGHWKTFRLSDEPMHRPPYDLFLALEDKKIDPSKFLVLEPGYEVNW
jgi:N-acyl-phosphatidylethanolamine-hydrolysing phospholipase D